MTSAKPNQEWREWNLYKGGWDEEDHFFVLKCDESHSSANGFGPNEDKVHVIEAAPALARINTQSEMIKCYIDRCQELLTEIERLKKELAEARDVIEFYSSRIKRDCQHDDPSWCNETCNDYVAMARQWLNKNKAEG